MGFLSKDKKVRTRQFKNRKRLAEVLLLGSIGLFAVFSVYDWVLGQTNSQVLHRSARHILGPGQVHYDRPRDEEVIQNNEMVNSVIKLQCEETQKLKIKKANHTDDTTFTYFKENFYQKYYNDICVKDLISKNTSEYETHLDIAEKCDFELSELYGTNYQKNGIYWCDSKEGLPTEVFNVQERRNGAVVLYFIGMIYMFYALAIVCDDYRVVMDRCAVKIKWGNQDHDL